MKNPVIGGLNESSLHKSLKQLYSTAESVPETTVDGYVIDIVHPKRLIEIQTGGFSSMRTKLTSLTSRHSLTLVHPVAAETCIHVLSKSGDSLYRRKSPKKGCIESAAAQLLYIADMLSIPTLSVDILLVAIEEIRIDDGKGSWRRKGVSIADKKLAKILATKSFTVPEDYLSFLPAGLNALFTNSDIAQGLKQKGIPGKQCTKLAGQISYLLRKLQLVKVTEKKGNSLVFRIAETRIP